MLRRADALLVGAPLVLLVASCGSSDDAAPTVVVAPDASAPDVDVAVDAEPPSVTDAATADADADATPPPVTITVSTYAGAKAKPRGDKQDATWAALQIAGGAWAVVASKDAGDYVFDVPNASTAWAIALVCSDADTVTPTVWVHHRTGATKTLEQVLTTACSPAEPLGNVVLTGSLSGVPGGTEWLDYGYGREGRGGTFPTSSATEAYELDNVVGGAWDVAFGVRTDAFAPLTDVAVLRNVTVSATPLDASFTTSGQAPSTMPLVIHGLAASESLDVGTQFTLNGGLHGIDVSPLIGSSTFPDQTTEYTTLTTTVAADRYRGAMTVSASSGTLIRGAVFDFHAEVAIDVTLLPLAESPAVTVAGTTPYPRFGTKATALPGSARVEITARRDQGQSHETWTSTYDAAAAGGVPIADETPDLSALTGWKSDWALHDTLNATITATSYAPAEPLGDGTIERNSSAFVQSP